MIERALLRLCRGRYVPEALRRQLQRRSWVVRNGVGAGLKISFAQNLDYLAGVSELPVQRALAAHLHEGGVFYDVGANVGFFSLIAARVVGPFGRVYSFEPVPANAAAIRRNMSINTLENIEVFDVAVSDRAGDGTLFTADWDGGGSLRETRNGPHVSRGHLKVPLVVLDDFGRDRRLRPPTFVKIDVEGAEQNVVRGMSATIRRAQPVLLYEVDDESAEALARRHAELDRVVAALGYRVERLDPSYGNVQWHVGHSIAFPR